jgi:hypothetical protein
MELYILPTDPFSPDQGMIRASPECGETVGRQSMLRLSDVPRTESWMDWGWSGTIHNVEFSGELRIWASLRTGNEVRLLDRQEFGL